MESGRIMKSTLTPTIPVSRRESRSEVQKCLTMAATSDSLGSNEPPVPRENEASISGGSQSTAKGSSGKESEVDAQLLTERKRAGRPRNRIPDYINVLENGKYQCKICTREFKTKDCIKTHEFCAKGDGKKPYKCKECEKTYTSKSSFAYHQKYKHVGAAEFECNSCSKAFCSKRELTRHQKSHTGNQKLFQCEECPKSFTSNANLKTHIRTHTGEKPFSCNVCQRRFSSKAQLRNHEIGHTNVYPFKCPKCDKVFKRMASCRCHINHAHSQVKRFKCDGCERSFNTRSDMRRHWDSIHEKVKPCVCHLCGKTYSRKDNLSHHLKSKHGTDETETIKPVQAEALTASSEKSSEMETSSEKNGAYEINPEENGEMEINQEESGTNEINPEENGEKEPNPEQNREKQINPEENGGKELNPEENGAKETTSEENRKLYNLDTREVVQLTTNWEHSEKLHPAEIIRPSSNPIDAQEMDNSLECPLFTARVGESINNSIQNLTPFDFTDSEMLTSVREEDPVTCTEISSTDNENATLYDADKDNPLFAGMSRTLSKSEIESKVKSGVPWKGVRNKLGESLLHITVKAGNVEALEYLCSLDAEKKEIDCRNEAGYTPLHTAALCKNDYTTFVETIVTLLENGASISSTDLHGNNLFHLTAKTGRLREMKFLKCLKGDLSIVAKNQDGSTPLHLIHCAEDNYTEMLEFLVNNGLDVNEEDEFGNSILHFAAEYKSTKEVNEIFKKGGQLRKENNRGFLPIHAAVANGNMGVVRRMIDMDKTLLDVRSKEGRTLLHEVTFASKNFVQLINTLVNLGADLNAEEGKEKMTPLLYYLHNGRLAKKPELNCLIARKANWKTKGLNGVGTLHLAAGRGLIRVVRFLIETEKMDVNAETTTQCTTPLHYLAAAPANFLEILELLCKHGADPFKIDQFGTNFLMMAASWEWRSLEDIKQILTLGFNVQDTNNMGGTALHFSARAGKKEVLEYLISINAIVNVKANDGKTPIHELMSTTIEFQEKLDVLLGANGDLNAVDNDGNNALFLAIQETKRGKKDLEYLVNCGAHWELINKKGENVVQIATESGNLEALKLFNELMSLNEGKESCE